MSIATKFIKLFIRTYQLVISPLLCVNCRFTPSCSHYATEAISTHGAGKGSLLTCKRLLRCQPFAKSGYDPVPPAKTISVNSENEARKS
jgi:putative membrane protein insertion efficiency factor